MTWRDLWSFPSLRQLPPEQEERLWRRLRTSASRYSGWTDAASQNYVWENFWLQTLESRLAPEEWLTLHGDAWILSDDAPGKAFELPADRHDLVRSDTYLIPQADPTRCYACPHESSDPLEIGFVSEGETLEIRWTEDGHLVARLDVPNPGSDRLVLRLPYPYPLDRDAKCVASLFAGRDWFEWWHTRLDRPVQRIELDFDPFGRYRPGKKSNHLKASCWEKRVPWLPMDPVWSRKHRETWRKSYLTKKQIERVRPDYEWNLAQTERIDDEEVGPLISTASGDLTLFFEDNEDPALRLSPDDALPFGEQGAFGIDAYLHSPEDGWTICKAHGGEILLARPLRMG